MGPAAIRATLAALVLAALAGCAVYAPVGPGTVDIHGRLVVDLDRMWSRQGGAMGLVWSESWTVNGPLLDALDIAVGVADGSPLVRASREAAKSLPRFKAGMRPEDIVELVQGTLASVAGAKDFDLVAVSPAEIAGHDGIRFEFKFGTGQAGSGIETDRHAIGFAFVADRHLYAAVFHAAELHYFDTLRPAAEAVLRSARLSARRT